MLNDMSSRQLTEWMAYYGLEPFGNELTDIHLARLTSVQVSTQKKNHPPEKFRLWRRIASVTGTFDPAQFYGELKSAFGLKKE